MRRNHQPKRLLFLAALFCSFVSQAQTLVTETDITRQAHGTVPTNNWVGYTRDNGTLAFVNGPETPPLGCGSLQFSTPANNDKAYLFNYDHIGTKLSDISAISYATYQSAGLPIQVASINLEVDFNGPSVAGGFTTLVFEPVYNLSQGNIVPNTWQTWDAINGGAGVWWSTRDIPGVCAFDCFVSWNVIIAANPNATILGGIGINQGGGNPGLISAVDAFNFNGTVYNFEPSADTDGDGQGDACDSDDDGDGVPDNADCDPQDDKNAKWMVCHNGKVICIAESAVQAHLDHGDILGACPDAEVPTAISGKEDKAEMQMALVDRFTISSYPNPTTAQVRIQYSVPVNARVIIKLYDVAGREAGVVFSGNKEAGNYSADLNMAKYGRGVFYLRMTATAAGNEYVQSQKLVRAE